LAYLIDFGGKQDKNIHHWTSDLAECKVAKTCDFGQTLLEVNDLKKECTTLKRGVETVECGDTKWDVFLHRVPQKYKEMAEEIDQIDKMSKDVEVNFVQLLRDWGESEKMPTKDFFGPLCDFMDAYEKEVLAIKAEEEKKLAETEKKNKIKAEKEEKNSSKDTEQRKKDLEERRKALDARKKEAVKKQEEVVKAEEIFAEAVGTNIEDVKSGATFQKRRLRRQTTLREKKEASEGAGEDAK